MSEDNPVDPAEVQTKPFAALLVEVNDGTTHDELSTAMQSLVAAVTTTGKAGTIQLTLRVEVAGDMVIISDKIVLKKPESRKKTLMFVDQHYNLVNKNPDQPMLPMALVADPSRGPLAQIGNQA